MKKYLALCMLGYCSFFRVAAQCPGAPLTLSTQSQVNNFPNNYSGCSVLNVSLTIQGNNINNLNGLSNITSITKSLFIMNNPALTSLSGLSNLGNIGVELTIDNNDALTNLNGLNNLPFIGGSLTITGNAQLSSLSALSGVGYVNGALEIAYNPQLTDLNGLNNVAFCGRYLQINNNTGLTALNSLNNMTAVGNNAATNGRYLVISSNPNMTTLNGLGNLESVGTDFEVSNNGGLTSLGAFSNLTTIGGNFSITANPFLTSVTDFASLATIGGGSLIISSNNLLSNCAAQGICDYLAGPGNASISNNDPGCNSVAQVEAACLLLPVELTFFEGVRKNDGILLVWKTASERDNAYFEVEYRVPDGLQFQTIGKVAGKGASSAENTYEYFHAKPKKGYNYYRLRQVDTDGTVTYSDLTGVVFGDSQDVEVFPNPTTGPLLVKSREEDMLVRVIDMRGHEVMTEHLSDNGLINLTGNPNGAYMIEVQADHQVTEKRVVKY